MAKVKLTKDWAGLKKGDTYETNDESVLKKGYELGLFQKDKEAKTEK